jgi:zinc protease
MKRCIKAFYRTYYVPNNALLVVVGRAELEELKVSADKWFGSLPKSAEPPRPADQKKEAEQSAARREVAAPAQIGVIMRGYHIPAARHADLSALKVLALILAGGESSRVYEAVVRKKKLAVQAGGQLVVREHPGLFMLFGAFLDPASASEVEAALANEVELLRKGKVKAAELRKAKNQLLAEFVYGLESVTGIANQIGSSWIQRGDPSRFLEDLEGIESVSAADIKRVANLYLQDSQSNVVVVPPGKGAN